MKEFITFLGENWRFLVYVFLTVLSTILVIRFKRKAKLSTGSLMDKVLDWIITAEQKFGSGHGEEKLSYVLVNASAYLISLGFDHSVVKEIIPGLIDLIETILSTPQKKEGI